MRTLIVLTALAAALSAAPKLKDKPPDLKYIDNGFEFDTREGIRFKVVHLYADHEDKGRAYCEHWIPTEFNPDGTWVSYYTKGPIANAPAGYFNLKNPTLLHIDALYRGKKGILDREE